MSTQFTFSSNNNPLYSSTTLFKNPSPKSVHFPLAPSSNFLPSKTYGQNSSWEKPSFPSKAILSQSTTFAPLSQNNSRVPGFCKLQNMARHLPEPQNEDSFSVNSQNSLETPPKDQFKAKRNFNPFASYVDTTKNCNGFNKKIDGKRLSAQPTDSTKRRRESIELNVSQSGIFTSNLKFLQRGTNVYPSNRTIGNIVDCGQINGVNQKECMKPKCYDFLKKRKDSDSKQDSQNSKSVCSQSSKQLQQFSHFRRPEQILTLNCQSKLQCRPNASEHSSPYSAIEFKKRKLTDSQTSSKSSENPRDSPFERQKPMRSRFMPVQRDITISDFQILDKLGRGAFGEVFMAQEKQLGFYCVIKKMSKKRIREAKVEQHIIRQIKLQSYLSHSHLTALYGYFHDQEDLYLILELLPDGSLQQVKKKRKLPEKETIEIVQQVAVGLKYMHEESVIHRDLKPENIFVNEGFIKLGDFGCSIYHNEVGLRNTIVGCLEYSSPEQLCKEGYSEKIDSWSLGILTYELLFGKSPFESDIKKIVMNNEMKPELSEVSFPTAPVLSEEGKSFIVKLLDVIPENRMDMDEVLAHPFLKQITKTEV